MRIIIFFLLLAAVSNISKAIVQDKTMPSLIEIKNGWQFRQADKEKWLSANVPGCIHTDLLLNSLIPDPFYRTNEKDLQWIDKVDWEYQTSFSVDEKFLQYEKIELLFKGLDTYADVYLNDQKILNADNMFREWKVDCKNFVKVGSNTLRVFLNSPIKVDLPKLKSLDYILPASNDQSENGELENQRVSIFARKAPYHYGWDWGPRFVTSGIWRPIYLRGWNSVQIENIQFIQKSLTKDIAALTGKLEINSTIDGTVNLKIKNGDNSLVEKQIHLKKGINEITAAFEIQNPKYWWPNGLGEHTLYEFVTSIYSDGKEIDAKKNSIGLRTVEVIQDQDATGRTFYFKVNGISVFMKGANYIPSDIFLPRVTDADYETIVKSAADANMNMMRVWGGGIYENDIFYDLCDKYGILLWHDFMFACSMYPGDEHFLENVKQEAIDNVVRLRNHPSIALWCGNNEMEDAWARWGWQNDVPKEKHKIVYGAYSELFFNIIPSVVKDYDGSRFYWPSSPSSDFGRPSKKESGDQHYWGVWHGKEPFENFQTNIGRFCSEYGFQSFPEFQTVKAYTLPEDWNIESKVMAAHQRSGIGNLRIRDYLNMYYKTPKDFESFLYVGQVLQAYGIKQAIEAHRRNMPYCMGSLYWQINDCWPVASWSSMDYYKRWKAVHYAAKKSFEPVIVSSILENEEVKFFIVSDKLKPFDAELRINVYDFNGDEKFSKSLPVQIKANVSDLYFKMNKKELIGNSAEEKVVIVSELSEGNNTVAGNIFYLKQPKDLALEKPMIKITAVKNNGGYEIELTSDKLAKDVFLSIEGDSFFSDNYFDLLPGAVKKIELKTKSATKNIADIIQVKSLADSF